MPLLWYGQYPITIGGDGWPFTNPSYDIGMSEYDRGILWMMRENIFPEDSSDESIHYCIDAILL